MTDDGPEKRTYGKPALLLLLRGSLLGQYAVDLALELAPPFQPCQ